MDKPNLLELFSGTQSVGNVAKGMGYNVISVDINKYKDVEDPTHLCDIMEFNYKQYPKGHFKVIHASPPCIYYSQLQNTWIGREKRNPITKEKYVFTKEMLDEKIKLSDDRVKKTLEIINYFNPKTWIIENPSTGLLKKKEFMQGIPFHDLDYCMYSNWGYKKKTRFWTNKKNFSPKLCNKKCGNMIEVDNTLIHKKNCGNSKYQAIASKHKKDVSIDVGGGGTQKLQRYRIPPKLVFELLKD